LTVVVVQTVHVLHPICEIAHFTKWAISQIGRTGQYACLFREITI